MSDVKHAKLPWGFHSKECVGRQFVFKRRFFQVGVEPGGKGVAIVFGDTEANAEFIVRACNNFDALLKAAMDALRCIGSYAGSGYFPSPEEEEFKRLRAAISKATGERKWKSE